MRDGTIPLYGPFRVKKMTLFTHQGGKESRGGEGEGEGLGWSAGTVSASARAASGPSKNAIIFLPYKARNSAITSAVNLSRWYVVM